MDPQKTTLIPAMIVSHKSKNSNNNKLNLDKILHPNKTKTATEPL